VPHGTTASAVSSLSLDPPMLLVCMNKSSSTGRAMGDAGHFAVNILGEGQHEAAVRFAQKGDDKFDGARVIPGAFGAPLLAGALATLECRIVDEVTGGTHTIFLAEVARAAARPGAPLAYFRGGFGRLEPAQPDAAATLRTIQSAIRARGAIELGAAALTVGHATARSLARLRGLLEQTRPDASPSMDGYVVRYVAFHEGVVELADSPPLLDAHRRADAPALLVRLTRGRAGAAQVERAAAESAFRHHEELVAAYEQGDQDAARRTIARHLEQSLKFAARYHHGG
jgi:flavin reductase (DIM6/NTAB) family NADH-FMN oxidoreductase RutF